MILSYDRLPKYLWVNMLAVILCSAAMISALHSHLIAWAVADGALGALNSVLVLMVLAHYLPFRVWWYLHKPWTGLTRDQQITRLLDCSSGICGCGQSMSDHSLWDNHSPTDIPYRRDWTTAWFCWFMGMDWRQR